MSENTQILKKLQNGKFREVDEYLSSLPNEILDDKLFYIVTSVLYEDSTNVDQDALKNLINTYKKDILRIQRMI